MAAKFVLDAHISPDVAEGCRAKGVDVKGLAEVMELDSPDEAILQWACRESRIVVTYDNGDFARHLADVLRVGQATPGVVFVSGRTIPPSDFGGLVRAIVRLAAEIEAGRVDPSGGLFLAR